MASQIKSKRRVAEHGEVFTAEREVNAMLDLVKQETERVDNRFLEPACRDRLYGIWDAEYGIWDAEYEATYGKARKECGRRNPKR